ncbi:PREDICTED: alanine--tRNA ligase, mitochondrial isoform X2 [Nicrophorus vespilloides]|uniref:Alanine--tRNA ligase n=1 Tax=Nicrophorus vespilloides TaxID=110193 RepID=A0ABM1ML86_NICVS|nr:PREDICTED: alanine--tRNA ligase, mitochondrial isoform X2 [Nicrophorus vespilloides]
MLRLNSNKVLTRSISQLTRRNLSNYPNKYLSSKVARQRFLDYFINENNYNFIRSSPVVPFYDDTVPFVNAGMNQFKGIFLGTQEARFEKVVNTQKCIRVGGKHNDLDDVGLDGYHHTFFEMLGNWSFGQCSKKESCSLAWKLLTDGFKINKNALYVTYFGGDEAMELEPDLECKDVWQSLGVPEDRILPFGMKENFWEMGASGPCGPCTEIHFDHRGLVNRKEFVNKGLHELIELWNIVFIEYNRDSEGKISSLPHKHVDTGMGFERLVAILQGKVSNYETDVFKTLFTGIQKISGKVPAYKNLYGEKDWDQLNTSYRILSDHARMITACLADGVIPEQNAKLRKIMRRSFAISENMFKKEQGLLKELSNYVIESLGTVYPEMQNNFIQIHQIIDFEEDIYKSLRRNAASDWLKISKDYPALANLDVIEMPGLVHAFKEITNSNLTEITPEFGCKLFDTYGLDEPCIKKLSVGLELEFDEVRFRNEFDAVKRRSKLTSVTDGNLIDFKQMGKSTDDRYKYMYGKVDGKYVFDEVRAEVLNILDENEFVSCIEPNKPCTLILDKTNMYYESGGQVSDVGCIEFGAGKFEVVDVGNINNYVLHKGVYKSNFQLNVHEQGVVKFNEEARFSNMRNHTATHLLNACLKQMKGATCQKSSKVCAGYLNLDVGIFGEKLSSKDIAFIEDRIKKIIKDRVDVKIDEIDAQSLLNLDQVTLVPGEVYPEKGIRLIEITSNDLLSREPCCGTHVLNTGDIGDFCMVSFKSLGRSTSSLYCVTGPRAKKARETGQELLNHVAQLQKSVNDNIDKPEVLEMAVASLKLHLNYNIEDETIMPYLVKEECAEQLSKIGRQIKEVARNSLKRLGSLSIWRCRALCTQRP